MRAKEKKLLLPVDCNAIGQYSIPGTNKYYNCIHPDEVNRPRK